MDIYILREGEENGPYSLETVRALLAQGEVAPEDFAWHDGLANWETLKTFFATVDAPDEPSAQADVSEEPAPAAPAKTAEPATAKQRALLSYLGVTMLAELSKDQAARLVNDAMEDPQNSERLSHWNQERLRLHPDLFAAEIQVKKENRANHFLELCQTTGAPYFSGITKAHCQVLVGFLDVKFPHWHARESEAAEHFFFPAVAEKFPQLVHKAWRGRLHYAEAQQRVAPELARKAPTARLGRQATSPLAAIARGLVLGGVILGLLYLGYRSMRSTTTAASSAAPEAAVLTVPTAAPEPALVAENAPAPALSTAPKSGEPVPQDANAPVASVPAAPVPDSGMSTAPMAALPPDAAASAPMAFAPMAASDLATPMSPTGSTAAPAPMVAPTPMADAAPMAAVAPMPMMPSALDSAPMAALPGTAPAPPPAAPIPGAAMLPGLPPEAAAIPPLAPAEMAPAAPPETSPLAMPATATKTALVLTKSVEVQLTYGKMTLPAGTAVKLVSRQGASVRVSYQNSVLTIPAASTDAE